MFSIPSNETMSIVCLLDAFATYDSPFACGFICDILFEVEGVVFKIGRSF